MYLPDKAIKSTSWITLLRASLVVDGEVVARFELRSRRHTGRAPRKCLKQKWLGEVLELALRQQEASVSI